MATYAVGDIQGCADEFTDLLTLINFGGDDQLWLVGDLVNRGPASARVMAQVMELSAQTKVVLGNHDLHFLAVHYGRHSLGRSDTMSDLVDSNRADEFAAWLCQQPLVHHDESVGWTMVHAGIPHIWSMVEALGYAREVSSALFDKHSNVSKEKFFQGMYGNEPHCWDAELTGLDRLKLITSYFTRMRLIDEVGGLDFSHKGALTSIPKGFTPWFEFVRDRHDHVVFGHWASLQGHTGNDQLIALDTGCVYGRSLSALCLETRQLFQVPARMTYSK